MIKKWRKNLKIYFERAKVPRHLLRLILVCSGLYKKGFKNALDVQLKESEVYLKELPEKFDGYKIIVISDFHIDSKLHLVPRLQKILKRVSADSLVLLGDYRLGLTGPTEIVIKKINQIIKVVSVKDGIFAVRGNHDDKELMKLIEKLNIKILDNDAASIKRDESHLFIVGVDDPHYDQTDDLPKALHHVPRDAFKILLAHTSEVYREAQLMGINLYLCGHTHGGQIVFKKIGPIFTNVHAPRKFVSGFWTYKNMTGYTSLGVGCSAVLVRFNCPPEIVVFTLKSA